MVDWQSLVDCNGLENRRGINASVGSNPTSTSKYDSKVY